MHKAQKTALETAELNGIDLGGVRRCLDTGYPKRFPCWRVSDHVVVYEDEPNCVVSIVAKQGRLVEA
jgi:hypothetical protein